MSDMSSQLSGWDETIHVLHVDDEPNFADMAGTFLERGDHRFIVNTATSVSDGLTHLNGSPVDCIVSDYDMPDQNGIEFLTTVREEYPELPFILYTGKGSEEIASDAITAGVTDYLQKESGTSQYTVLANRIRNAVEQYRSKQQVEASQRRLSLFVEQSPLGVIEWTEDFDVAHLNDTAREILGYSERELRGASWERIVPDSNQPPVAEVVTELLDAEGGYHSINENVRKDGERIVCEWHNRVVTDDDGDVVAIFSQFQDVTEENERKTELQRKERQYQAVFNDPNILVGSLDTDGSILDINETAMEYVDTAVGDIVDEPLGETPWFNHDETLQQEIRDRITRAANGEYVEFKAEHVRLAGNRHIIQGVIRPVRDVDGTVSSLLVSGRDITEQKKHERELERTNAVLSTLFETLPVGVLAEDAERNVLAINDRLFELFEMSGSPAEVIGADCERMAKQVSDLFVDAAGFIEQINELIAEQEATENEELALEDGRTLQRSHRPIELPDGDGNLWVYRDITDLKEREQTLQRERDRLDEFARVVSHDLQTPLTVAEGRLELAQEECETEHHEAIKTALDRIKRLTEDVLWLARTGRDIGSLESVHVGSVIDSTWELVADNASKAELVYVDDDFSSMELKADYDRLRQLLENLLRNAIQHGGDDVRITVGTTERGFYIEDDGPGIPEDQRGDVFEAGYSSAENGTGFGLSIVKQVAEAHEWNIAVSKGSAGGARIEITNVEFTG